MISPCYNSCPAKTVNLKECVAALRINSILLKTVMTASACLKETQYLWKYLVTASGLLKQWGCMAEGEIMRVYTTQMYGCKYSFEITIRLK